MQFGWNFLFSRFYQEIKKLIWYFNYNIMILICQTWMKFCKQFIYFIFTHTHIYYVDFLGKCLFFIWVYLDKIYSSTPPTQDSWLRHCLPSTPHNYLYLRSDHRIKGVWWLLWPNIYFNEFPIKLLLPLREEIILRMKN